MNHVFLILKRTFNQKKPAARHNQPILLVEIGSEDDVSDTGFIFHRYENETLCRTGPLPRNRGADIARLGSVRVRNVWIVTRSIPGLSTRFFRPSYAASPSLGAAW